jgi:uncharacterized protein (UPF0332 family)
MQSSEFQDSADRLAHGTTEGDWRSAVSRSYYAVFHSFREFLLSHGIDVGRSGQSHFNMYTGLLNCGYPQVAAIASRIDGLRVHRVWADYDLSRPMSKRVARTMVQESTAIVADFQTSLTAIPPAQIAAGTRRHLQSIGRLRP